MLPAGAAGVIGIGSAGAACCGAGAPFTPLMTELLPPWPMIVNTNAPTRNSVPSTVVARVRTVAPERAPKAVWLLDAAEGRCDVAALALLEQDDHQQQQADQHVQREQDVVEHSDSVYPGREAAA